MDKFLDLQNGFYNALTQGLGFHKDDPFQVVQPSPPLAVGSQADTLLWNYFNNIPPFSLTQNYISSGGNQFFSNYMGLLSALKGAPNSFREDVGEECATAWLEYVKSLAPPLPMNQVPMTFRNWAMLNGYSSVANIGASDLAALLLDPVNAAQFAILEYKPNGANNFNWVPGYDVLIEQLSNAPTRSFELSSSSMDSNVSSSWTRGSNSGFFGLWGGSSYESSYSSKFASSSVNVEAEFDHVLPFYATPGDWYSSSAMGLAYSNKSGPPWNPESPINWSNTFDPKKGNLVRFASNLIVVDKMNIMVSSQASFTKEEQEVIQSNSGAGMWPFYSSNKSHGSNTRTNFSTEGHMTVEITSSPKIPIVIGITVIPISDYVGHAVEGARIYAASIA